MMDEGDNSVLLNEEIETEYLGNISVNQSVSLDMVAAVAGDRPLSDDECRTIEALKLDRGNAFYSDLFYAITHQYFPPQVSQHLWNDVLLHKCDMSYKMERNVRITVAALDYLSNLTSALQAATVISETHIADIVRLSLRDSLTGLFNHAFCFHKIDQEIKRFARYKTALSLMMIDVDNFKNFNDQYGHQEGDKILTSLSHAITEVARNSDITCRYGGEEFAVIMPSTNAQDAAALADRLRGKLAEEGLCGHKATISIGVAPCTDNTRTSRALVEKADVALFQAKRNGKNQVVIGS